jgi:hypothetical protein
VIPGTRRNIILTAEEIEPTTFLVAWISAARNDVPLRAARLP